MDRSTVTDIAEAEKRDALQRVVSSATFQRSDQLKSLLRYVCERAIAGQGDALDEYTVAVEALGRPRDYSALEDGSARNRIHTLRNKLEHYYRVEHPDDVVRIALPKGSYCPLFQRRVQPAAEPALAPSLEIIAPAPTPVSLWEKPVPLGWAAASCGVVILLFTIALMAVPPKGPPGLAPVLAEAWGPLLLKDAKPLICIATAAQLTLIQRPMPAETVPRIVSPDLLSWYNSLPGLPRAPEVYLGPSLTSPFWGDVAGAFTASHVLAAAGTLPEFLPESALQLPALNRRNLLMFGRPGFSNTVDLLLRDKPFRIRIPDDQHNTSIWNVNPKPGELEEYDARQASRSENRETAFGLITVMPSGGDPNLQTVVFSGTLSPGTQAASEFFASPEQLSALRALFRKEGFPGFPPSYQVLTRSHVFNTSALDVQYVTHRVISRAGNRH